MSTNRTQNYQLHVWTAEDEESLAELNANFAKLDGMVAKAMGKIRVVSGSYTGDDSNGRLVRLGFRPKAVLVSCRGNGFYHYNTIYLDGVDNGYGTITNQGFTVSSYLNWIPSSAGGVDGSVINPYHYVALWWQT